MLSSITCVEAEKVWKLLLQTQSIWGYIIGDYLGGTREIIPFQSGHIISKFQAGDLYVILHKDNFAMCDRIKLNHFTFTHN